MPDAPLTASDFHSRAARSKAVAGPGKLELERQTLQTPGGGQQLLNQQSTERADFQKANPGVDIDTSLPALTRARVSVETSPGKQSELLTALGYPARLTKDGRVVAKMGNKEVLLHPLTQDISASDVAGAAAPIGKAGVAAGLSLIPGVGPFASAAIMGGGMAATDAASKSISRAAAGQPQDPKDLATSALKEGAINAALPLAGATLGATARGVQSVFAKGAGQLEKDAAEAAARQGLVLSPAQATGSPTLAKTAGSEIVAPEAQQALALAKGRATGVVGDTGPNPLASEADIAGQVKPIFAKAATDAEKGATTATNAAAKASQDQIQAQLDAGLVPSNLTNTEAGGFLRGKLEKYAQGVKDAGKKNYDTLYAKAAEEGIALDQKPLTALVNKIAAEDPQGAAELLAPSIKQVKAVEGRITAPLKEAEDTGLLDQFGKPIVTEEVPSQLTLDQAINLRAIVRKKLESPQDPLGDVVKRYYAQLNDALNQSIEGAVGKNGTGSAELKQLYEAARAPYAEGAQALEKGVLPKLFSAEGEAGHVADQKIVPSLVSGAGNLEALKAWKAVLGKDYPLLQRQAVNHLAGSPDHFGNIDAGSFLKNLNRLDPDVRKELLGPLEKELTGNATLLAKAQGTNIPQAELEFALAASPGRAGPLLQQAIAKQEAFDLQFNNSVQKQLRNGVLEPKTVSDDHFVTSFLDKADTAEVRQALTQIRAANAPAAEDLSRRTMANILDSSGAKPPLTTGTTQNLDPEKLAKFVTGTNREKYRAVLGKEGIQFLDDMLAYAKAQAKDEFQARGGRLSPSIFTKEAVAGAAGFERNAIGATVDLLSALPRAALSRGQKYAWVRDYLTTGELPPVAAPVKAALFSTPEAARALSAVGEGKEKNKKSVFAPRALPFAIPSPVGP